jgi:hypothetical protein
VSLQTYPAGPFAAGDPFVFQVPGQYAWRILSVLAHADRQNGGTGVRAFQLSIASGAQPLVNVAAVDTAPDPGVMSVCWAPVLPGTTALVTDGAATIPLPEFVVPAGYIVTGTILNPVAGDLWADAAVWVDQSPAS